MPTLEDRIRARAQGLWEEEGRPEGRAEAHWEKARRLVAIESDPPVATRRLGEPAEEGALQENPREIPAHRTDERGEAASSSRDRGAEERPMAQFWNWWHGTDRSKH